MVTLFKTGLHTAVQGLGYELKKVSRHTYPNRENEHYIIDTKGITSIHYGCGIKLLKGWINVDSLPVELVKAWRSNSVLHDEQEPVNAFVYQQLDLTARQPFPGNSFAFGFSEDFIEHLTQAESINFLSECYRVLKPGGVLRLSFPGLEGVLKTHYKGPTGYGSANEAKKDCYDQWEHIHFYSREELSLVATHLGYANVEFPAYGQSTHGRLSGLDTRANQQQVNTYAELKK